jgi:hypothetical protein
VSNRPNLARMVGDHIRFVCGRDDALTRVKRVLVRYASFEEMLDVEGAVFAGDLTTYG